MTGEPVARSLATPGRRSRWATRLVAALIVVLVVLLLVLVPLVPMSQEMPLEPNGGGAATRIKFVLPTEVRIHFAMRVPLGATFTVNGPGLGTGLSTEVVGGRGETVSFWTWGGTYTVRIGDLVLSCPIDGCPPSTVYPAWVNVTTGVL